MKKRLSQDQKTLFDLAIDYSKAFHEFSRLEKKLHGLEENRFYKERRKLEKIRKFLNPRLHQESNIKESLTEGLKNAFDKVKNHSIVNYTFNNTDFKNAYDQFLKNHSTNEENVDMGSIYHFFNIASEAITYYFTAYEDIEKFIYKSKDIKKSTQNARQLKASILLNPHLKFTYKRLLLELDKLIDHNEGELSDILISSKTQHPELKLFVIIFTRIWRNSGLFINNHALGVYKSEGSSNPLIIVRPHITMLTHLCNMLMSLDRTTQVDIAKTNISEQFIRAAMEQEEKIYDEDLVSRLRLSPLCEK